MVVKLLEEALGTDLRAPGFPPALSARDGSQGPASHPPLGGEREP
jgi:hypothetical protein